MSAEAGKNIRDNSGGAGEWPGFGDMSAVHCSGHVVPASFVRAAEPEAASSSAPLSGTTCIAMTVHSNPRPSTRTAERVASRVVENRTPDQRQTFAPAAEVMEPPGAPREVEFEPELASELEPAAPLPVPPAALAPAVPQPLPALPGPVTVATAPASPAFEHRAPTEPPQGHELLKFHRLMRGRYKWAAMLALVGLLGGAYAGWKLGVQTYQSTGAIRVMAVIPKVMYQTDEKGVPPMFEGFVKSHAELLRSQRVMNQAMLSPEWAKLNRGTDDEAKLRFAESITVTPQGEIIWVCAEDRDPGAAMVAVKTLIGAYDQIRDTEDSQSGEKRLEVLQALQVQQNSELGRVKKSILEIAQIYSTDDLGPMFAHKLETVQKLESSVAELRFTVDSLGKDPQATRAAADMTPEELAVFHPRMQRLLDQREGFERRVRELVRRLGEGHNETIIARGDLKETDETIEKLASAIREQQGNVAGADMARPGVSETVLRDRLKAYEKSLDEARKELVTLGNQQLTMQKLRDEAVAVQQKLDETQQRIDELNVESTIAGRTSILSSGDRPLGPYKDTRITFSAAAGLGGAMLGFGLIAGLALCDRRLRSPDQAVDDAHGIPMLGLLPRLSLDLSDPEEAATAAHCVHEIRTLLQVWGRSRDNRVFAVTSPSPGSGKTSLTLALGAAYALAGRRTLLIDGDLVGAGLTTRVDAIIRRRIGRILRNEGLVTQEQLDEALRLSKQSAARLGEILVQLGYVSEKDLKRAVLLQQNDDQPVGLIDALRGHDVEECVVEVGIDNFWVLPAGSADARYVPALTPEGLQRLVNAAREKFDIVLIDTGPMPGSLEASIVTALADGAILTVSKGEHKPLVQRSISQLMAVGANVVGVVFNRANPHDVSRYGSSSSASLRRGTSLNRGSEHFTAATSAARFGPLAQAVASFAPGVTPDAALGGSIAANDAVNDPSKSSSTL